MTTLLERTGWTILKAAAKEAARQIAAWTALAGAMWLGVVLGGFALIWPLALYRWLGYGECPIPVETAADWMVLIGQGVWSAFVILFLLSAEAHGLFDDDGR